MIIHCHTGAKGAHHVAATCEPLLNDLNEWFESKKKDTELQKKKKLTHITVCQFTFQLVETEQIQPRADP